MGFLDFIKNRGGQGQAAEQPSPQPETAKQMYTRQTFEDKAAPKPTASEMVRPEQEARATEAKALFDKAVQEPSSPTPPPTPAPDGAANPQPMQQKVMGQGIAAPELSPTSGLAAARARDVDGPSAPASTPAKSPQQTVARPAPSWER